MSTVARSHLLDPGTSRSAILPPRPEVAGCLSLAEKHRRAAEWTAPRKFARKHREKVQKLMARAERLESRQYTKGD